jgi:hypothetical protein
MAQPGPTRHVVIIVKENHRFDNYFGRFPGANGDASLVHASDPPKSDHPHDHATWLRRARVAAREQYFESDIPAYWAYARQYMLCDNYFSDVAGPSTPNHLMLIAAASPIINNPNYRDPADLKPPFDLPSLPANLRAAGLTWRNYGGYAFDDITELRGDHWTVSSGQFAMDANAGALSTVSWVYAPAGLSEHPTESVRQGHGLDGGPGRRHRERRAVASRCSVHHLGRLGRIGRPRQSPQRRAVVRRHAIPVWLSRALPRAQPVRVRSLHQRAFEPIVKLGTIVKSDALMLSITVT